jgi:RHS repeat-associated protein
LYEFSYDSVGRLTGIADGSGNLTTVERDQAGNPLAVIGPYGQRSTLTLNKAGYLAAVTNPASASERFTYVDDGYPAQGRLPESGLLVAREDARGSVSSYAYDERGRLVSARDPVGGSRTLARKEQSDPPGTSVTVTTTEDSEAVYKVEKLSTGALQRNVTGPDGTKSRTVSSGDGSTNAYHADGTLRLIRQGLDPRFGMGAPFTQEARITTPGGLAWLSTTQRSSVFDAANLLNPTSVTEVMTVNGNTTRSVYDGVVRKLTTTSPVGRQKLLNIDTVGRVTSSQTAGIEALRFGYDSRGRLSTVAQGSGTGLRSLAFGYNPQGLIEVITDPLGRVSSLQYDLAGRVTRQVMPDGREMRVGYDSNGNVASITPPGGSPHTFSFTPVDLTQTYLPPTVADASNVSTSYRYNTDKQLTRITRPDGQAINLGYNAGGKLATQVTPTGTTTYTYAANSGRLASISAPGGIGLGYDYDGFLLRTETWSGPVAGSVARTYDNNLKVAQVVFAGQPVSFSYDNDGLLVRAGDLLLTRHADNSLVSGTTLGQVTTAQNYDSFGALNAVNASHAGTTLYSVQLTRDKVGRIAAMQETVQGVTNPFAYAYDLGGRLIGVSRDGATIGTYVYDANGNRIEANGEAATYDDQDRLVAFGGANYAYTANGELRSKTIGGLSTQYEYDVLGNLRAVTLPDGTTIEYVIDGRNRRIGKKVNGILVQGLLYQSQLKPLAELDGAGRVVSLFVYATRINVPDYMVRGGVIYRFVADHLGSPRLVVNAATGAVAQRMDYDEWGNVIADTNPGFQPFGFGGGLYDRHTGLVRLGKRDYDANLGRWTTKDPMLFRGGDSNLYAYANGDPINRIDPFGHMGLVGAAAGALVGAVGGALSADILGLSGADFWMAVAAGATTGAVAGAGGWALGVVATSMEVATGSTAYIAATAFGAAHAAFLADLLGQLSIDIARSARTEQALMCAPGLADPVGVSINQALWSAASEALPGAAVPFLGRPLRWAPAEEAGVEYFFDVALESMSVTETAVSSSRP